jgi:hypothetical protein
MQRTTSGAAGNGLHTTIKYMRGAAGIGLGTTTKHLRRTTSGAAGNGLGTTINYQVPVTHSERPAGNGLGATMKYLRQATSSAANNGLSTTAIPPCSAAPFVVSSDRAPHRGTSLGPFVCGARACSLCLYFSGYGHSP